MFTKAVTFRNFLIKNLKQYIRSKSTRYSYSEEEYADRQKYNNIRVPKFNFPIYKVPRRGDEVSKRPGIYKEIEEDVEEEKPQAVINVNTLVEPERNRKNFFENFDKNERIEEEKDDHWLFDVPIRHDTETDENYNKIILAPMFLVFCALIDFAVDSFTV